MDSDDSKSEETVDIIFSVQSIPSSVEPPMEEWSSLEILLPEENKKKISYRDGLYDPGSGEICAQYIAMSASSVLRHPYYTYPPILDPGIEVALLAPERKVIYPQDGQDLYLATCKEMNQCPVRSFHRGLLQRRIDLQYYCINPNGFLAMAKALQYNNNVEVLNLTDNFLNDDACYHMADMLLSNKTLTELNLRGCRIGPQGARRLFCNLPLNTTLKVLDLSYNKLGDEGMEHLAKAVLFGLSVEKLNLSYNNITGKGVALLVEPFETHNKFTHLDLSWNKIYSLGGHTFLAKLSESTCLEGLNLSWNSLSGPRIAPTLRGVILCPLLSELDLSNNKLDGETISDMVGGITKAKKLKTLNLSFNPLTPKDALSVLQKVGRSYSHVQTLLMDNVDVNGAFISLLEETNKKESKKGLVVTYGGVVGTFKAKWPDAREVVLNRVEFLTARARKHKADIALIALQLQKDNRIIMNAQDLDTALQDAGAYLDEDLVTELCIAFPGPPQKSGKVKVINMNLMAEYIKRKWPDRKLPPTPPPEPEPELELEPEPIKTKGKRKEKK